MKEKRADVIIPAYRPDDRFFLLVQRLMEQTCPPERIIVMNTEKALWDGAGAGERIRKLGAEELVSVRHVTRDEFDHGHTRNVGASLSEAPYMVFMTQDAVPEDRELIRELLSPMDEKVRMTYARQLPYPDADPVERISRAFNYPDEKRVKTEADRETLGIKTYFASNVCAAYDREIFGKLGGFTDSTLFNEDMIYAAGLMKAGYAVCYAPDAMVRHSHSYTGMQQLKRNFDLAVSQADHPEVFSGLRSESEGIRLVKRSAKELIRAGKPLEIIRLVWLSGCKYLGYRLGKNYKRLPRGLIRRLTSSRRYWAEKERNGDTDYGKKGQ